MDQVQRAESRACPTSVRVLIQSEGHRLTRRVVVAVMVIAIVVAGLPALPWLSNPSGLLAPAKAWADSGTAAIGVIKTAAGNGSSGYSGDGGPATSAKLWEPSAVALDAAGNLYIADMTNVRVRKVDTSGVITTVAGNGTVGHTGDGGAATAASLSGPTALAFDSTGNLYIADSSCCTGWVRKVNTSGIITTVAGNGAAAGCSASGSGDGGPATAAPLDAPDGLAVDGAGNLYIADMCSTIRKVNASGIISTVAGKYTAGYSGDGGPATSAQLNQPGGVRVDSTGSIYIADTTNRVVRKVDTSGTIHTFAGNGTNGYSGDGGSATAANLSLPEDVALDSAGDLFIADVGDSVIRKVNTSGIITSVAGGAGYGYSGDGGYATAAQLEIPYGVTVDTGNNFYIADQNANVIREVTPPQAPAGGALAPPETYGPNRTERQCQACAADPVSTASGDFYESYSDLATPGRGPALALVRSYNSLVATTASPGPLGYGWTHSYAMSLKIDPISGNATVTQESGSQVVFTPIAGGGYGAPPRVLATLVKNGDGTFALTRRQRDRFVFSATGQLTKIADLNGYSTTLAYNGSGQLASVTDPAGRALTLAYNSSAQLTSVTDPIGRVVAYSYSPQGDLITVSDVGAGITTFAYDTSHRIVSVRDPRGALTTNTYDSSGRVTTQVDPMGHKTTFAYSGDNFSTNAGTTTITDPNGNVTVDTYFDGELLMETRGSGTAQAATWDYLYDPNSLGVVAATDPNVNTTNATYDSQGNQLSSTDALGHTTSATYDTLNDVTSRTDALGVTTTDTYDTKGNMTSQSTPLVGSSPAVSRTTTYTYADPSHPGDVTTITDPNGKIWSQAFDANGDLVSVTDPLGNKTTATYDGIGRRLSAVSPLGNAAGGTPSAHTTTYSYDAFGDLLSTTDPLGHSTTTAYDADRNPISVTDANGHTTRTTYDANNRPTAVTRADGTTLANTYDADGNLTAQTNAAGAATTYAYDAVNRRINATDPLHHVTSYAYDPAGNLVSLTDAASNVTTEGYDAGNRLTAVSYSNGHTPNVTYGYDADGRRTSMADGTGTTTSTWDSLGRLTAQTNGAGAAVSYGWDLAGNLTSIAYPSGMGTVSRAFDAAGRLNSVGDWLGHTTTFGYDADSNLAAETYPNTTSGARTYDNADRLSSITDNKSGIPFASFSYTRDANGQLTAETPIGVPGGGQSYTYTSLNQLASVNTTGLYSYNSADDPVQLNTSTAQHFDPADQLTSTVSATGATTTYTYDARGDRTTTTPPTGTPTSYGHDQVNRLISYGGPSGTVSYGYDGAGLLASRTAGAATAHLTWDASGTLPQLLSDGTNAYIRGPGGQVIEQVKLSTGAVTYLHQDQLGSTRLITDATGMVVGSATYDPYGNLTGSTGTATTPVGWAGEYRDATSGLTYLRARWYDPATAQFLSRDPLVGLTRLPYGYASDNPVNRVDPTGQIVEPDGGYSDSYVGGYSEVAIQIGSGHGFDQHIQEFAECDQTRDAYMNNIDKTMGNYTYRLTLQNGRTAYYNEDTNIIVIVDPNNPDAGTAFRPRDGADYLNTLDVVDEEVGPAFRGGGNSRPETGDPEGAGGVGGETIPGDIEHGGGGLDLQL